MLRLLLMFYECCLIVSNTAPILFVTVLLGSNGDTHQSIKRPVSVVALQIYRLFSSNIYRRVVCKRNISTANRLHNVAVEYEIKN